MQAILGLLPAELAQLITPPAGFAEGGHNAELLAPYLGAAPRNAHDFSVAKCEYISEEASDATSTGSPTTE